MKISSFKKELDFLCNVMKLCQYDDADIILERDIIAFELDKEDHTLSFSLERFKKFEGNELSTIQLEVFGYNSGALRAQKTPHMTKNIDYCDYFNLSLSETAPVFLEYEILKKIFEEMDNLPETVLYSFNICKLYRSRKI